MSSINKFNEQFDFLMFQKNCVSWFFNQGRLFYFLQKEIDYIQQNVICYLYINNSVTSYNKLHKRYSVEIEILFCQCF